MILRDDHDADWTASADSTLERRVYYAQNWRADVVALMADNGRVLERTWYEAYGTPHGSPAADLTGSADSNSDFFGVPDGVLDSVDYSYYLTLYNNSDARADLSGSSNPASGAYGRPDGTVDSVDYFFYLAIYAEGATAGRGVLSQTDLRNRKGYAGYEWDPCVQAATMVFHVRNRVLMTETGRWSRRDPLGHVDGVSLYEYVGSAAMLFVDPLGLDRLKDKRSYMKGCARRHGGYRGYTTDSPYKDCVKKCKSMFDTRWVKSPDDIPGSSGDVFCSWDNAFMKLSCNQGGANIAVITCHANAKDGPYYVRDGIKYPLGDPSGWPQAWVDALQGYDEVVLYCCYIGNTDYPQRVADRIQRPVRAPGRNHGPIPGEVILPWMDPRYPGECLHEPGKNHYKNPTWPSPNPWGPCQ